MTWIRDVELAGGPFWHRTALAVGLAAATLLILLARGERGLVSRKAAGFLLALRLLAAGLLALSLAEPVASRVVREPMKGRVIVAVDLSDSMATVDRDRPADQAQKLRDLLKADVPIASRREIVRRLLEAPGAPLAKLAEDHDLDFFAFAGSTTPTSRSGLIDRLGSKAIDGASDLGGNATDWRPLLAEAARPSPIDAPPRVAVVLIGDGRFHASDAPGKPVSADPATELAALGIPVFPLLIGSEAIPRDLAVVALNAPETAFLDDTAPVEARLVLNGFAGREVAVTLEAQPPGKPPFVSTQTLKPATDRERPSVRFQVPLPAAGAIPLTVRVAPVVPEQDARRAEARLDNNSAGRTVEVTGEPARVLLIDGEPRWEFRYLRNALARDPRASVEAIVLHQPTPELPADQGGSVPTYGTTLPGSDGKGSDEADPLGRFDAIILGDVAAADIPSGFWDRLEAHVSEQGGTLIVVPGPLHWRELWGEARPSLGSALSPLTGLHTAAIDEAAIDPMRPALPAGVAIVPTPDAIAEQSAWPMFRLQDREQPDGLSKLWADLPRQPWALIGRPKPGATALAVVPAAGRDSGSAAVISSQRFGLGRVFWIGIDGTWRWRHRVGDPLHHRFWGQTVRWAAASAKLTAGDGRVRFGATRTRVEAGDPVRIRARISEAATELSPQPILAARVVRVDGETRPEGPGRETLVPLRPLAGLGLARTFEGDAPPLTPGRYAIRLEASGLGEIQRAEATFEVVPRATGERVELAASRAEFDALARTTGGRVVADFEADRLPDLLRPFARTSSVPRARVVPLWDRPATLLVFLAIVSVEWIVRKRAGLP